MRAKVTPAFLLIMVLPVLLLSAIFLFQIERDAIREQEKLLNEYTAQVGRSLDLIVDEINQLGQLHVTRYDILLALRKDYEKYPEDFIGDSRLMADLLGIAVKLNQRIYRLTFVGRYGQTFTHFFPPYLEYRNHVFDRIRQLEASGRPIMVLSPALMTDGEGAYIPIILELHDPHTWVVAGYALIDIHYGELAALFSSADYDSRINIMMISEENVIFDSAVSAGDVGEFSPVGEAVMDILRERSPLPADLYAQSHGATVRYNLKAAQNASSGWQVVVYSEDYILSENFWNRVVQYMFLVIILVTLSTLYGRRLFVGFMNQVNLLRSTMHAAQDGYIATIDSPSDIREMEALYESYNGMATRILQSVKREYSARLLQKKTEMDMLLLQINPHFLYNTLNLIRSIAQCSGIEEIDRISLSLSEILRYSLTPAMYVSLEEELKQANDYIVIQQMRFPDSVFVEQRIDASLLTCRVIKFILQPIVENSFRHALEKKKGDRRLTIEIEQRDGFLIIAVSDNGVGMPPPTLDRLQRQLLSLTENPEESRPELGGGSGDSTGIGLVNVHKRLLYAYGAQYGVWIESWLGEGTVVKLTLPVRDFDDENATVAPLG